QALGVYVSRAEARAAGSCQVVGSVGLEVNQSCVVAPGSGDVVEGAGQVGVAQLVPRGHCAVVGGAVDFDRALQAEQHRVHQVLAAAFGVVDVVGVVGHGREDAGQAGASCLVAGGAAGHVGGFR